MVGAGQALGSDRAGGDPGTTASTGGVTLDSHWPPESQPLTLENENKDTCFSMSSALFSGESWPAGVKSVIKCAWWLTSLSPFPLAIARWSQTMSPVSVAARKHTPVPEGPAPLMPHQDLQVTLLMSRATESPMRASASRPCCADPLRDFKTKLNNKKKSEVLTL